MRIRDTAAAATLAYDAIKKRIIEYDYPPGSKLSEARLVDELGFGRSPIRSAFARLRSEGWIDVSPQSGTYVKALNEQEVKEIFEFRLLLETYVARMAAVKMTPEQLRKLRLGLRRLAPLDGEGFEQITFEEFDEFDSLVHAMMYQAAGNTLVSEVLLNLLEKAQWLKKTMTASTPERMKIWFGELEKILEALEAHDPDLAAERMRDHIGHAADFELKFALKGLFAPSAAAPPAPARRGRGKAAAAR